jgi:hypothetical protein
MKYLQKIYASSHADAGMEAVCMTYAGILERED